MDPRDSFGCVRETGFATERYRIADLRLAERNGLDGLSLLAFPFRVIAEFLLRREDGAMVSAALIREFVRRAASGTLDGLDIPFMPRRIVMQDYAGLPVLVDIAALRSAHADAGNDPSAISLHCPATLVIDHSLVVDASGSPDAAEHNLALEYSRNAERYRFLKWAQTHFEGLRVVPPGNGIIHQINLEALTDIAGPAWDDPRWLCPDSVLGTDSHTTMVNGLGVLGWGVGGIEAEALMLGTMVPVAVPPITQVRLSGQLRHGVLGTDLALTLAERLRAAGVTGHFIEFTGPGSAALSAGDRATVANMAPEYGATCALFPPDSKSFDYLRLMGRPIEAVARAQAYLTEAGLDGGPVDRALPGRAALIDVDLATIGTTVAGPLRPHQRLALSDVPGTIPAGSPTPTGLNDGDIVLAAITSCTNTSNPEAMMTAGLLARRARALGLGLSPQIKASLAPGSRAVARYLDRAGLLDDLAAVGFHLVGFGCATCVGNSGDLLPDVERALADTPATVAAVLSGNRNFAGRIHPLVKANFLMSPALVVAYALAGSMRVDLSADPIGEGRDGPVHLADLWPERSAVDAELEALRREDFEAAYQDLDDGGARWAALRAPTGEHPWEADGLFIKRPDLWRYAVAANDDGWTIAGARMLLRLGDDITTDHISPVGRILPSAVAGRYLGEQGVAPVDLNSFGAWRGNDEVMLRGTFANPRLCNELCDVEGPFTRLPDGETLGIYDAAQSFQAAGTPLIIVAGRNYGMGSARDWAAKGTRLLGVRAVIAESFERIHRTNLALLGVLPLQFLDGQDRDTLGLAIEDEFTIAITDWRAGRARIETQRDGRPHTSFEARIRLDTEFERDCFRAGGVLARLLPSRPNIIEDKPHEADKRSRTAHGVG